jgi:hypothetical protein
MGSVLRDGKMGVNGLRTLARCGARVCGPAGVGQALMRPTPTNVHRERRLPNGFRRRSARAVAPRVSSAEARP